MDFQAEIIRTTQRKLVSNDQQYEIVFRTNNPMLLDLGKLPSDSLFDVSVNLHSNTATESQKLNDGNDQRII